MKKTSLDIDAIRKLHHAGQLDEAKKAYLAILKKHPTQVEALHELGILCAQQQDFSAAIEHLQTAAKQQPDNTTIQINLGNALKTAGLFQQAAQVFQAIITRYPDHSHALN